LFFFSRSGGGRPDFASDRSLAPTRNNPTTQPTPAKNKTKQAGSVDPNARWTATGGTKNIIDDAYAVRMLLAGAGFPGHLHAPEPEILEGERAAVVLDVRGLLDASKAYGDSKAPALLAALLAKVDEHLVAQSGGAGAGATTTTTTTTTDAQAPDPFSLLPPLSSTMVHIAKVYWPPMRMVAEARQRLDLLDVVQRGGLKDEHDARDLLASVLLKTAVAVNEQLPEHEEVPDQPLWKDCGDEALAFVRLPATPLVAGMFKGAIERGTDAVGRAVAARILPHAKRPGSVGGEGAASAAAEADLERRVKDSCTGPYGPAYGGETKAQTLPAASLPGQTATTQAGEGVVRAVPSAGSFRLTQTMSGCQKPISGEARLRAILGDVWLVFGPKASEGGGEGDDNEGGGEGDDTTPVLLGQGRYARVAVLSFASSQAVDKRLHSNKWLPRESLTLADVEQASPASVYDLSSHEGRARAAVALRALCVPHPAAQELGACARLIAWYDARQTCALRLDEAGATLWGPN
jgi:hypothetical protein